jgi:ABC-type nickel/cobalt efflux system permease component RcnA
MHVKWGSLGEIFVVSFGVTVLVVVVFALGILAASARQAAQEYDRSTTTSTAAAAACFAACAGIVAYGLYLIIPQFHK